MQGRWGALVGVSRQKYGKGEKMLQGEVWSNKEEVYSGLEACFCQGQDISGSIMFARFIWLVPGIGGMVVEVSRCFGPSRLVWGCTGCVGACSHLLPASQSDQHKSPGRLSWQTVGHPMGSPPGQGMIKDMMSGSKLFTVSSSLPSTAWTATLKYPLTSPRSFTIAILQALCTSS